MIKGQALKSIYESHGADRTCLLLREGLAEGVFKPSDFSIRELAETFLGPRWFENMDPRRAGPVVLAESGMAVDPSAFSNITGQLLYNSVHDGWKATNSIADRIFETRPTQFQRERIPGVGMVAGREALAGSLWPVVVGISYVGLPVGFVLLIVLLGMSYAKRGRRGGRA